MSMINVLDDNTINKIAAGEVVEKPAAVIKELVENSIDAGSTAITVEIKNGGLDMMRITDNGRGISTDDIRLAFERHATSKIRDIDDLNSLTSLGFRGEALASIAAVSKTECITKTADDIAGIHYEIAGGIEESFKEVGCPNGTTIVIRDLFYNTPARRKFLKAPGTEASYISDLVERIALSHPEISFRYLNNGQLKLNTNGCGRLKDIIFRIYGKDITDNLIPLEWNDESISVTGFLGRQVISRGNRGLISTFVNGRYIKSPIIYRAIDEGYNGYLMQHRFPFAILMITVSPDSMDVNVHPSKQEIRFSDGDAVFRTLTNVIKSTIRNDVTVPEVTFSNDRTHKASGNVPGNVHKNMSGTDHNTSGISNNSKAASYSEMNQAGTEIIRAHSDKSEDVKIPAAITRGPEPFEISRINQIREQEVPYVTAADNRPKPVQQSLFDMDGMEQEKLKDYRIAGCVFSTYWIIEYHDEMYIMDQHAAHEKVLYEQFCNKLKIGKLAIQQLSPPIILTLTPAEAGIVVRHKDELEKMGFVIDEFGGNEYKVSSIPADLPGIGSKPVLMDMIAMLSEDSGIKSSETLFMERLATMSCKAAVKGGRHITEEEAYALVKELFTLENPFACPHGRPTMIKMTKYELEKKFGRIV